MTRQTSLPGRTVFFLAAGLLMLASVAMIVADRFGLHTVPQLWIAVPAIAAQAACISGLVALRPLLERAIVLSRLGLGFALIAATVMATGGAWLAVNGAPGTGNGIYLLAFAYIVSICLGFGLFAAAAFRVQGARSVLPYLLLAPAVLWTVLVVAAVLAGPQIALSLDWLTNAAISVVLLAIAGVTGRSRG